MNLRQPSDCPGRCSGGSPQLSGCSIVRCSGGLSPQELEHPWKPVLLRLHHRRIYRDQIGKQMHVTMPSSDGQDQNCPHQFVGRCEACTAADAAQGAYTVTPAAAAGSPPQNEGDWAELRGPGVRTT